MSAQNKLPGEGYPQTVELATKSLGRITCAPMTVRQHINLRTAIAQKHKSAYPDPREFASFLLSVLGKRPDAQESPVSLQEAEGLEDEELEEFATAFLENNQWLSKDLGVSKADEESYQAYLLKIFKAYDEKMEGSLGSLSWMNKALAFKLPTFNLFSNATLELLKRNESISKTLAGSIGQIHAAEEAVRRLDATRTRPKLPALDYKLLRNPVHDTNQLLAEVRDVMVQAADLTKSLNDTTIAMARDSARANRRIIRVGVISVVVAVVAILVTAFLNWEGLQNANQGAGLFRKAIQAQSQSFTELSNALANSRTAALALVGWYLMTPPFIRVGPDLRDARRDRVVPDSDAPLSKWKWSGSFDSLDACQRNQEKEIVEEQKLKLAQSVAERNRTVEMDFREARCIATDDPRLKEK